MAHYLRPNHRTRTPTRVVCFDTETTLARHPLGSEHHFRLAVASLDVRRATARAKERTDWGEFTSKAALWEWIDGATSTNHATWLYAHNLEFDLTTSDCWTILPAMGWEMAARAAGGGAPWVRWRRGDRSLVCADLAAWVRRKLADVGDWVGVAKLRMPKFERPDAEWFAYCRRDVEVTRAAVLALMDWVDIDDLGNWSLSSAGQAWRVFRHRFMDEQLLVHDDPAAQHLERAAGFGGRREVYQVGSWKETPVVDLDFRAHYMTTAGRIRVPRRLAGVVDHPEPERVEGWAQGLAVIAEVEVSTDVPVAPVRTPAGIVYPVGTFRTTLAWPELSLVAETGGTIRYLRAALYQASPVLVPWATWLDGQLHGPTAVTDRLRAHVLKQWSRELVGKFGQRANQLERIGPAMPGRGRAEPYYPAGDRTAQVVVNRTDGTFVADRTRPGENAIPSVFCYVTSAARVALWRALVALGPQSVLAVDTDGLLALQAPLSTTLVRAPGGRLTGAGDAWEVGSSWRAADHRYFPGELVVKHTWDQVEIRSPEAMILNGHPRVAGVPRSASRTDAWEFQGEIWPGADWQLGHRGTADYVTVVRRSLVRHGYTRRQVLADGTTRPWVSHLVDGVNVIPGVGVL